MRLAKVATYDVHEWHDHFCLMPRILEWSYKRFELVWLETIQRRRFSAYMYAFWEYRIKPDGQEGG